MSRDHRATVLSPDWSGKRVERGLIAGPELPTPRHATMIEALAEAARQGDEVGIEILADREGQPSEHRSYRRILEDARRMASALASLGLGEGDRVLLVLPTGFDFVAAFFGAQLLGAIPVPGYPPAGLNIEGGLRRLVHIADHAGAEVCVAWKRIAPIIGDLGNRARTVRSIAYVEDLHGHDPIDDEHRPAPEAVSFLQYTSGSTGHPKGVAVSYGNVVANLEAVGRTMRVTPDDRVCGWCPLYHDMGLVGTLLLSIYWHVPLVLLSPFAFLSKPVRWLRAMSEDRTTLSNGPNFGAALAVKKASPEEREGLDLSSLRLWVTGAEPVDASSLHAFEEAYAPHGLGRDVVLPVYGLAEVSLAVSFPDLEGPFPYERVDRDELVRGRAVPTEAREAATLVSVGHPLPGHGLAVVDDHGEPLPERRVGHVLITGPGLMRGYWNDPDATAEILRDGWFATGDLGYVAGGDLYIAGRSKDVILVRGENYFAEDIERGVEAVEGVRPGGVAAFGAYDEDAGRERVVLVCESRATDPTERERLTDRVAEAVERECGFGPDEVVLAPPGTVPKTSSGKRQRFECRRLYLEGELEPERTGKLELAKLFVRSKAGLARMRARELLGRYLGR